jgi:RES domain-containing protein
VSGAKKADKLFDAIMKSGWDDDGPFPPTANDLYTSRKSIFHSTLEDKWQEFCSDVMENPEFEFDDFWEEDLQKVERKLRRGTVLFRARLGFQEDTTSKKPYEGTEIGAPPVPRPGRSNDENMAVLYCADTEDTAVAEVRPCRGLLVSVAKIRVKKDLRIVDLTVPLYSPNPFIGESARYELEVLDVLRAFGGELGKPLERADDVSDYRPCQKLAKFIEKSRFDGIRYPSAMAPRGNNVVLFDPSQVKILVPSWLIRVTTTSVDYQSYEPS